MFFLQTLFINAQENFHSQIQVVENGAYPNHLTVKVTGFGKNQLIAENQAMKDLFMTLFFRGIPESPATSPLINSNETEILNKYKKYFNQFFDNSRYSSFINKLECSQLVKINKQKRLNCIISINIQSLKDDLRSNKIITDYGF